MKGPQQAVSAGSRMTSFHEIRVEGHIEAMFVHVFYYFGGHDVFQDLAEDASKGYWTVVYSLRFVTLFEHWCYVSLAPFYGKFSCFD